MREIIINPDQLLLPNTVVIIDSDDNHRNKFPNIVARTGGSVNLVMTNSHDQGFEAIKVMEANSKYAPFWLGALIGVENYSYKYGVELSGRILADRIKRLGLPVFGFCSARGVHLHMDFLSYTDIFHVKDWGDDGMLERTLSKHFSLRRRNTAKFA